MHVRPELVVEIAFDGVQTSSRYPGGVALRFARVVRYRPDKRADEADTIDAVRALADLDDAVRGSAAQRAGPASMYARKAAATASVIGRARGQRAAVDDAARPRPRRPCP